MISSFVRLHKAALFTANKKTNYSALECKLDMFNTGVEEKTGHYMNMGMLVVELVLLYVGPGICWRPVQCVPRPHPTPTTLNVIDNEWIDE